MLRGYRFIIAAACGVAISAALGAGAFFGALYGEHYSQEQARPSYGAANPKSKNPSQIDRDRAGLPYFAERIASGPEPQDGAEREKRDLAAQESMSVWAFWMLIVASASAVVTAVGTGFLLWQIILTRKAVEDTGEATKAMGIQNRIAMRAEARSTRRSVAASAETARALAIAQTNADATERALVEAREMAIKELRARIIIVVVKVSNFRDYPLKIRVKIKNFGKTNALNIKMNIGVSLPEWPVDFDKVITYDFNDDFADAPLAPGQDTELTLEAPPTDSKYFDACSQGRNALIFKGFVDYVDEFGIDRQSFFNVYCGGDMGISFVTVDGEPNIVNVRFAPHGNNAT